MVDSPAANLRYEVDIKTLELLVCPLTKTRLVLSPDKTELISVAAHLAFPIRDGVPMLSLDEARDDGPVPHAVVDDASCIAPRPPRDHRGERFLRRRRKRRFVRK